MIDDLNILIVEDDEVDRMTVIRELKRTGKKITISEAASAEAGFAILKQQSFDCLLLDYWLPDCEGLDFLGQLTVSIPVIVLTGRDDEELGAKMIQQGAQDYLIKGSVNGPLLLRAISYAIERKKSANALLESSSRFRSLFEVTSDCIFILDRKQHILQTNPAAVNHLGYSEEELIGKNLVEFLTPSSQELFILQLSMPMNFGIHRHELEIVCKNRTTIPVDCSTSIVSTNNGNWSTVAVSLRDITNHKLAEEQLRKGKDMAESVNRQMQNELEIAREIQEGLYPTDLPQMDGLSIAADLFQARQVGGDFYDIIPINNHEMAFIVVDVAGHDIAAAFVVGMAKLSFCAHIKDPTSLVTIFKRVNEDMLKVVQDERFLSAFLGIIDTHTRVLRYAKAGHSDQCLYKAASHKIQFLRTNGMFIGAFEDGHFEEKSCPLDIGDKLILFTDGLFENRNQQDEHYGLKRLYKVFAEEGHIEINTFHERILREHRKFCQGVKPNDDICLVIAEIKETFYHHQFKSLLQGQQPTIPPIDLDSQAAAKEAIFTILSHLDKDNYPDALIRHYKKVLPVLVNAFQSDLCSQLSKLKTLAYIDDTFIKIILYLEELVNQKSHFFKSNTCRSILNHFNKSYGTIDLNESGDRLIFTYHKNKQTPENNFLDVTFDLRSDGTYITVPINLDPSRTLEVITDELLKKSIINVDYTILEKALIDKSGIPVKLGDRLQYYNEKKNTLFSLILDPLKAKVMIKKNLSEPQLTLNKEDILFVLRKKNVVYGIRYDTIQEMIKNPQYVKEYVVAIGKPPIDGQDAVIEECIKVDPTCSPIIKKDGSVDHKMLDLMKTVNKGTVIIKKQLMEEGKPGISIFGRTIDPIPGKDKSIPIGEQTEISEDGIQLIAKVDGYLYRENDYIHAKQLFYVPANVDYSTGNLKYQGDVYISGNVLSGFSVTTGGTISVYGEIEAADLVSEKGSIFCRKGILGKGKGRISAQKSIEADFIQDARVSCKGDLLVKKNMLNVKADIKGNIQIGEGKSGMIMGGEIHCQGSIAVAEIGNKQNIKTVISMEEKQNLILKEKIAKALANRDEMKKAYNSLENQLQMKSRLFKIKAKKSVAEKQDIEKLLSRYYFLKKQIKRIELIITSLKEKEKNESPFGEIAVARALYPNVILKFGKRERRISSPIGPVIFKLEEGEIVISPYR